MFFLLRPVQFSMADYGLQVGQRLVKVIIDNQVVKFARVRNFRPGFAHAHLDNFFAILSTPGEAVAQCFQRRREDENRTTEREGFPDLPGALPVYVQQDIEACTQFFFYCISPGSISVAEHFGMLEKGIFSDQVDKGRVVDIMVMDAILLARARSSCGVGNRKADPVIEATASTRSAKLRPLVTGCSASV